MHSAVDILPLQLLSGFAFVASLYAALSCEFLYNHFTFDKAENGTKSVVGFGIYSREGFYVSDHLCSSYSSLESNSVFDTYFKLAVYTITMATVAGAFNFLYSVSMWFVYFRIRSLVYKIGIYFFCTVCGIISQLVYLSNTCHMNDCNILPNGSTGSFCFRSHCTLGKGSTSISVATLLWIACIAISFRLVKKKKKDKSTSSTTEDHKHAVETSNHYFSDDVLIEQMENKESFETILCSDEESTEVISPEKEQEQNWLRRMYKDFMETQ